MKFHPNGTEKSMSPLKYCLDTHPLIWYFTGQKTLSTDAKDALDDIFSGKADCFISSIVLLETFHLSIKKKSFNFLTFLKQIRLSNVIIVPLDKVILSACYRLPKNLDIHDRVITATSLVSNSFLITKDPTIRKLREIETLW